MFCNSKKEMRRNNGQIALNVHEVGIYYAALRVKKLRGVTRLDNTRRGGGGTRTTMREPLGSGELMRLLMMLEK